MPQIKFQQLLSYSLNDNTGGQSLSVDLLF